MFVLDINEQSSTSLETQQQNEQEQGEGQPKPNRGRGNSHRGGQYNYGNRNPTRRGSNQYYQSYRNQRMIHHSSFSTLSSHILFS